MRYYDLGNDSQLPNLEVAEQHGDSILDWIQTITGLQNLGPGFLLYSSLLALLVIFLYRDASAFLEHRRTEKSVAM